MIYKRVIMFIKKINFYNYNYYSSFITQNQQMNSSIEFQPSFVIPKLNKSNILYFTSNIKDSPNKRYNLNNKTILLTGGTGTIGNYIIEELFKNYNPKKVIIFSRDEMKQHTMKIQNKDNKRLEFVIGDVRNFEALNRAFRNVNVVIHAAAMKHVPICEENPEEAVLTNILGAKNIINAAINNNVDRVFAISSDKASSPTTLYGATKFVSEKLFNHANTYTDNCGTKFSCVRLGNVLGSRGSIIPVFKEQSKNGNLKVTDPEMTRFFMTPKQASDLILSSVEIMNGGEIFVPKLKTTRIMALAKRIAPDKDIDIVGIRQGEKLSEEFISDVDAKSSIELDDRYVIMQPDQFNKYNEIWKNAKQVPKDINYNSSNEKYMMSDKDLDELISQYN